MKEKIIPKKNTVIQTHWVDDGNGGLIPIEKEYIVKDKGWGEVILTPVEKEIKKEEDS